MGTVSRRAVKTGEEQRENSSLSSSEQLLSTCCVPGPLTFILVVDQLCQEVQLRERTGARVLAVGAQTACQAALW